MAVEIDSLNGLDEIVKFWLPGQMLRFTFSIYESLFKHSFHCFTSAEVHGQYYFKRRIPDCFSLNKEDTLQFWYTEYFVLFPRNSIFVAQQAHFGPLQTILTSNTSAEVHFDLCFKPSIPDFSKLHEENAIKLWDALYYVIKKKNSKNVDFYYF